MRARVAVLASGGGSNLQAILDYFRHLGDRRGGDVVVVASDRAGSGALKRAATAGIAGATLATPNRPTGESLADVLERHRVDLVALAGYMRLVPPAVVARFSGRMLNVHPALLPAFGGAGMYGRRVHEAVLDAGAAVTGATIHFVDEEYDRGTIIAQWPVAVRPGDDADTLAARVLAVEHVLYPRVLDAVAAGTVTVSSCPVLGPVGMPELAFALRPSDPDHACLAAEIERALGL